LNDWQLIEREIGWSNTENGPTIRKGWAIESINAGNDCYHVYAWIENNCLAIHDPIGYYPSGCYDIPLDMIELLKEKNKNE